MKYFFLKTSNESLFFVTEFYKHARKQKIYKRDLIYFFTVEKLSSSPSICTMAKKSQEVISSSD